MIWSAQVLPFLQAHWIGIAASIACIAVPASCAVVKPEIIEMLVAGVKAVLKKKEKKDG